jgi:hypothetical protein
MLAMITGILIAYCVQNVTACGSLYAHDFIGMWNTHKLEFLNIFATFFRLVKLDVDRLCGLVVRVSGC